MEKRNRKMNKTSRLDLKHENLMNSPPSIPQCIEISNEQNDPENEQHIQV